MLKPVLMLVVVTALASLAGLAAAAPQNMSACARGYSPCLPVRADLDCGQIPDSKKPVRVTGADPYGLDADHDGLGCEVSGEGGGRQSPWGLILRKPPSKEATSAKVGDTLTVVGWSPSSFQGKQYSLCVDYSTPAALKAECTLALNPLSSRLKGTVQKFGTWKILRAHVVRGVVKVVLRVDGKDRVADSVPVR